MTQSPTPRETVLTHARVVTGDAVFDGTVVVRDGVIADVSRGPVQGGIDCEGDYLIPGLVELHTDNLERHLRPRPGVEWPRRAAVSAHDGEFAAVGVSTLFDALRVGVMTNDSALGEYAPAVVKALAALRGARLLRCEHFIHLRCELCADDLLREFDEGYDDAVRLISLMDHTPGQRQFRKMEKLEEYYMGKHGYTQEKMTRFIADAQRKQTANLTRNTDGVINRAHGRRLHIASHDDTTAAHVEASRALGATLAEFPTTAEAARASRAAGMKIIMGAPNLLRGTSHSGNVSAMELAAEGLVDILSSDYAPASLILAAFKLAEETDYGLPRAIACVSRTPAQAVGLDDRGMIAPGARADLARVYRAERLCVVRGLWRAGARVA